MLILVQEKWFRALNILPRKKNALKINSNQKVKQYTHSCDPSL